VCLAAEFWLVSHIVLARILEAYAGRIHYARVISSASPCYAGA